MLVKNAHGLTLVSLDRAALAEVLRNKKIAPMLLAPASMTTPSSSTPANAAGLKQLLLKIGLARETSPATSMVKAPDQPAPGGLAAARIPALAADSFWAGGSGWWCCHAGKMLVGAAARPKPARSWSISSWPGNGNESWSRAPRSPRMRSANSRENAKSDLSLSDIPDDHLPH